MLTLPKTIIHVLRQFEEVLSQRVWQWAKVLLTGALLVPGERTVASILRVMGCSDEKQFQNYHRVLKRAKRSSRELSRRLLILLVRLFVPASASVLLGIDETIERRRGRKMAARGVSRDPVRESSQFFVKTNGLRWICLMLLTPIPWAWQMILPGSRGIAGRHLVVVADGTSAVLDFRRKVSHLPTVCVITRLRLDACWYDPAPLREAHTKGRTALKGKRQPKLAERRHDPNTIWQKHTLSW